MSDAMHAMPAGGSGEMFDAIAPRYDLLNRILSLGTDQSWRRRTVAALALSGAERVLDLATGTADLAIRIAQTHRDVRVVGLDPSRGMLAVGARKIAGARAFGAPLGERVDLVEGDAQALPFEDASFDGVTIAFGIRNVPDRRKALSEMWRVLKPGGRVAILELSEPSRGMMAALARFHIHTVVPRVGALLSGRREYDYLQRSIAAFPAPAAFVALMAEAGFSAPRARPFMLGAACLFTAEKPA